MSTDITLYDYDKISDNLCYLANNIVFKFNVGLSRKNKDGMKEYFHSEYEYDSSYLDRDNAVSIQRRFNYFYSINVTNSFDSNVMIRVQDMIQVERKLNKTLEWFENNFSIRDNRLVIIGDCKPIRIDNLLGGRFFDLEPIVIERRDGTYIPGVRLTLCGTENYADIEVDNYMGFVYLLLHTDMYNAALSLINYLPINAGVNHHKIEEDSYGEATDFYEGKHITISNNYNRNNKMQTPKESFFEKSIKSRKPEEKQHEGIYKNDK